MIQLQRPEQFTKAAERARKERMGVRRYFNEPGVYEVTNRAKSHTYLRQVRAPRRSHLRHLLMRGRLAEQRQPRARHLQALGGRCDVRESDAADAAAGGTLTPPRPVS